MRRRIAPRRALLLVTISALAIWSVASTRTPQQAVRAPAAFEYIEIHRGRSRRRSALGVVSRASLDDASLRHRIEVVLLGR